MNRGEKGMGMFVINGGNKLHGSLFVKGAKNSMLPIMAASVLNSSDETINLYNIPDIYDMHVMKKILQSLGAEVHFENNALQINVRNLKSYNISDDLMREMRSRYLSYGTPFEQIGKSSGNIPRRLLHWPPSYRSAF